MSNDGFWKSCLKFFLLCVDADSKRQEHVGRSSYNPDDDKFCPVDPAFQSLNEQMIHDADVNAGRK